MYKGEEYIGFWVNTLINVPICAVVSIAMPLAIGHHLGIGGMLNWASWLQGFVLSYFIGFFAGTFIPHMQAADAVSNALHIKAQGGRFVMRCLIGAIIMTVFIAFFMVFANSFVDEGIVAVLDTFVAAYPWGTLASFATQLLTTKLCQTLATKIALR